MNYNDRLHFAKTRECRQPKCSPDLTLVLSETTYRSHSVSEFQDLIASIPCAEPIAFCSLLWLSRSALLRRRYCAVQVQLNPQRTPFWKPRRSRLQCHFKERRRAEKIILSVLWGVVKDRLEALIEEMLVRGIRLDEALGEFEKRFLQTVLARTAGNQCKAAELVHVHRNTLARKIAEHRLKGR